MPRRKSRRKSAEVSTPPWRQPVGLAFLRLDSSSSTLSEIDKVRDHPKYLALLQKTFSAFSDTPVGSDVLIEDLNGTRRVGFDAEWAVDIVPMRGLGEGDQDILYESTGVESPNKTVSRQTCWNCLQPGHSVASCPHPRNHLQVRLSREKFLAQKEAMPEYAIPYLESYTFTEEERTRRLQLANNLVPGTISDTLADAVFWVDPYLLTSPDGADLEDGEVAEDLPDEVLEMQGMRRRRAWPWLIGMLRWGYPPGWIASKDPIDAVKMHIEVLALATEDDSDDDEEFLKVFGGFGTPTPVPSSPSTTSSTSTTSGSDMSLSNDSSSVTSISSAQRLSPNPHRTSPDLSPRPPHNIPAPPAESPPPPPRPTYPPARRWARYDTDMFDSTRLTAYTSARPLPLGS